MNNIKGNQVRRHPGLWGTEMKQQLATSTSQLVTPGSWEPTTDAANEASVNTVETAITGEIRQSVKLKTDPLTEADFNPAQFLAALSQLPECSDQWVTIIGKPPQEALQQLVAAGISLDRIRCIASTDSETACWATEQALLLNNSQVVLAWLGPVAGREQQRLRLAARASQAVSFLFTHTSDQTSLH